MTNGNDSFVFVQTKWLYYPFFLFLCAIQVKAFNFFFPSSLLVYVCVFFLRIIVSQHKELDDLDGNRESARISGLRGGWLTEVSCTIKWRTPAQKLQLNLDDDDSSFSCERGTTFMCIIFFLNKLLTCAVTVKSNPCESYALTIF